MARRAGRRTVATRLPISNEKEGYPVTNENQRMIARIDEVIDQLHDDDVRILTYIRTALTPAALADRDEWDTDVSHLHATAKGILRRYDRRVAEGQHE